MGKKTFKGMNHDTFHKGIWVEFNGWRMKDLYDIKLKSGEVLEECYPNGCSWNPMDSKKSWDNIKDKDVTHIRLKPDSEIKNKWWNKGKERDDRNVDYFGGVFPEVLEVDGVITFKEKVFEERG